MNKVYLRKSRSGGGNDIIQQQEVHPHFQIQKAAILLQPEYTIWKK